MKTSKKAQGLSMETIIIAILALIVLVVIVIIFTGKTGESNKQLNSCETKGGACIGTTESCTAPAYTYTCATPMTKCCLVR